MLPRCMARQAGETTRFLLNICRIILTKFCTEKNQGKKKTKFKPADLNLIFKVTEVILSRRHVKDDFLSISEEIFDVYPHQI